MTIREKYLKGTKPELVGSFPQEEMCFTYVCKLECAHPFCFQGHSQCR